MSNDNTEDLKDVLNDFEDRVVNGSQDDIESYFEEMFEQSNLSEADKYYKQLGEKIRKAREEAGLTLAELAKKVRLTGAAISNYEMGIRQIPVHILMEFSKILNKPVYYFLGPEAEPAISIKETLIDTLQKYTEATYAKRIMDLQDGKLSEVIPEPLIPMPPESCHDHDITIRLETKREGIFNYYFIKLARPKKEKQIRTRLGNSEVLIELKADDWVLARIGDTHTYEITQFKNIKPSTVSYTNEVDLLTFNVAGLVIGRVERLVEIE